MATYIELREKSRYIHQITKGVSKDLSELEATNAEEYAETVINGYLGKFWVSGKVPKLIEKIADMLASAKVWDFTQSGQSPLENGYAEMLKKEAMKLLEMIKSGQLGLQLPDGTFDEDYPGASSNMGYPPESATIEIII